MIVVCVNISDKSLSIASENVVAKYMNDFYFVDPVAVSQHSFADVSMIEIVSDVVMHCHKITLCTPHAGLYKVYIRQPSIGAMITQCLTTTSLVLAVNVTIQTSVNIAALHVHVSL